VEAVLGKNVDLQQRSDSCGATYKGRDHFRAGLLVAHSLQEILGQQRPRERFVDELEVWNGSPRKETGEKIRQNLCNSLGV